MALNPVLISGIFLFVLMLAVWIISLSIQNAGIVDIAWAGGLGAVSLIDGLFSDGYPVRRSFITFMAAAWSFRLTLHLYRRVMGHHPNEDVRYIEMRKRWTHNQNFKFLLFFEAQALLSLVLSLSFLIPCQNTLPQIKILEGLGFVIWVIALLGESLADTQLKAFKLDPANRGKVCRTGLWNYSRHPNYFFEWLVWVGFSTFALASPRGWLTLLSPALMFFFLYAVTGIPLTEELSVKSKGDAYREYQRTTSAFIPWFKKS